MLGGLAFQFKRSDAAIRFFKRAIEHGRNPSYLASLGEVYRFTGKLELALDCYRQAVDSSMKLATKHGYGAEPGSEGRGVGHMGYFLEDLMARGLACAS